MNIYLLNQFLQFFKSSCCQGGYNDQTSRIVDEDSISGELQWLLATTYITELYITHSVYYSSYPEE